MSNVKNFIGVGRCFGDEECKKAKRKAGECVYDGLESQKRKSKNYGRRLLC